MKSYDFRIQTKAEADAGHVMFPEMTPGPELEIVGIGVSEKSTAQGKTGVLLLLQRPGEEQVHPVLMTANAYLTIAAGIKGAMERFNDPWGGP